MILVDCSLWLSSRYPSFRLRVSIQLSSRTRAAQRRILLISTQISFYDKRRSREPFLESDTLYKRLLPHQSAITLRHVYERNPEPSSGIRLDFVPRAIHFVLLSVFVLNLRRLCFSAPLRISTTVSARAKHKPFQRRFFLFLFVPQPPSGP